MRELIKRFFLQSPAAETSDMLNAKIEIFIAHNTALEIYAIVKAAKTQVINY